MRRQEGDREISGGCSPGPLAQGGRVMTRSNTGVACMTAVLLVAGWGGDSWGDSKHRDRAAEAMRSALGSCMGDPQYDLRFDLDGSGCIDANDVWHFLHWDLPDSGHGGIAGGGSEVIVVEDAVIEANPGGTATVRLRLINNAVPLFGYSAAVRVLPLAGAVGSITANVAATNFFEAENLILAAPSSPPLDPFFSVIVPWGNGGVFVNANTEDGSAVLAELDVNDILAEVHFAVSADATGSFEVVLGPPTALADGGGFPVPFGVCLARISVGVPIVRPGDLNGDGAVNGIDVGTLLAAWGECGEGACAADLNCDRVVNGLDLAALLADWGTQ